MEQRAQLACRYPLNCQFTDVRRLNKEFLPQCAVVILQLLFFPLR